MSDVDDLVTWLRQQLDDDERAAHAWLPLGNPTAADREHIARHDPARVLRQVERDRRILDEVVDEATGLDMQVDGEFRVGRRDEVAEPYLGDVLLRLLALPYADRPGYRDEWRP